MRRHRLATALLAMTTLCTAALARDDAAPAADTPPVEFDSTIQFDPARGPFALQDLRGKMVVVVFFQSWCGICNGWSPDMFKQMTETFGDDPTVALLAVKTDGNVNEAKAYLSPRCDVTKWNVVADPGANFYVRMNGADTLFGYALLDADGRVAARGKAGMFYTGKGEGGKKEFVLANQSLKKKVSKPGEPLIPADLSIPELAPAIRAAELGDFQRANAAFKKAAANPKTKEAATKIQTALDESLAKRVAALKTRLADTAATDRFDAYMQLRRLSTTLLNTPHHKEIQAALNSVRTDKAILADLAAERAYLGMMTKLATATDQQKAQLPAALKQFADAHKNTLYAARATAESDLISSAPRK
jgi:hypothetical protein